MGNSDEELGLTPLTNDHLPVVHTPNPGLVPERKARRGSVLPYSDEFRSKAEKLFVTGECKTLAAVARKMGMKQSTLVRRWAARGHWEDKRLSFLTAEGPKNKRLKKATSSESRDQMLQRHAEIGRTMVETGRTLIDKMPPRTVTDVVNMIEKGIQLERQAKGMGQREGGGDRALTADEIISSLKKVNITQINVGPGGRVMVGKDPEGHPDEDEEVQDPEDEEAAQEVLYEEVESGQERGPDEQGPGDSVPGHELRP